MALLTSRQQSCPPNPNCPAPDCSVCGSDKTCSIVARDCQNLCPQVVCTPKQVTSSGGISTGALAGSIVAVFTLAIIAGTAFFWYRRRSALARAAAEKPRPQDIPANPELVLSRPDPIEKTPTPVRSTFGLPSDAHSQRSVAAESFLTHDPFADQASIQTASARTHSPNVITIGLIPPPDGITALNPPPPLGPQRPARSPDLSLHPERSYENDINLAHVNVSNDSLQPPNARFGKAKSSRSVRTTASGLSTFSTASSAIDILTEVPQIVTPKQGAVRQVLGVVKAEVVQVGAGSNSPGLHPLAPRVPTRPARSPLAQNSYTSDDIDSNPFGDESGPSNVTSSATSVKSNSTFGQHQGTPAQWTFPPTPTWPADSRPTSMQSNAGTIIADIGSATRIVFGMQSPQYATNGAKAHMSSSTVRSSAQPGTPPPSAQEVELERRVSQVSVASSRADSILEAFPFVPPSPIAARPPRSPLGMTFTPPSPGAQSVASMAKQQHQHQHLAAPSNEAQASSQPPTPTQRNTRGLSAMSSSSGLSGLGAFPFKFPDEETPPLPHTGKRASLDTLALSRDLEAFPLPYDDPLRDSFAPSTK